MVGSIIRGLIDLKTTPFCVIYVTIVTVMSFVRMGACFELIGTF
jgi:uncharacterized protein YhfF